MDETFGCCSHYIECSDKRSCIHSEDPEYKGCKYRRNLEAGRIFYGKNKFCKGESKSMEPIRITLELNAPDLANAINNLADAFKLDAKARETTAQALAAFDARRTQVASTDPIQAEPSVKAVDHAPEMAPESAPEKMPEPAPAPAPETDPLLDEAPPIVYSLVQVREKLTSLSKSGKQAQVKTLISKFGATKLSEVKEADFGKLMAEAEAL